MSRASAGQASLALGLFCSPDTSCGSYVILSSRFDASRTKRKWTREQEITLILEGMRELCVSSDNWLGLDVFVLLGVRHRRVVEMSASSETSITPMDDTLLSKQTNKGGSDCVLVPCQLDQRIGSRSPRTSTTRVSRIPRSASTSKGCHGPHDSSSREDIVSTKYRLRICYASLIFRRRKSIRNVLALTLIQALKMYK